MRFAMQKKDFAMEGGSSSRHVDKMWEIGKSRSPAFTLTELLVVMAILGLLAGLAIPAVKRGLDAGKCAQCANNLKQMGIGFQRYAAENDGTLPMAWFNNSYAGWPGWDVLILDYLEVGTKNSSGNRVYSEKTPTVLYCPADSCRTNIFWNMGPYGSIRYSYRLNLSSYDEPGNIPLKIVKLPHPAKQILVCDGEFAYYHHVSLNPALTDSKGSISKNNSKNVAITRHSGAANYLFVDGHVEKLKWAETWDRTVPGVDPNWGLWRQR